MTGMRAAASAATAARIPIRRMLPPQSGRRGGKSRPADDTYRTTVAKGSGAAVLGGRGHRRAGQRDVEPVPEDPLEEVALATQAPQLELGITGGLDHEVHDAIPAVDLDVEGSHHGAVRAVEAVGQPE